MQSQSTPTIKFYGLCQAYSKHTKKGILRLKENKLTQFLYQL